MSIIYIYILVLISIMNYFYAFALELYDVWPHQMSVTCISSQFSDMNAPIVGAFPYKVSIMVPFM